MIALFIFSILLFISFSIFVFMATWYIMPKLSVTNISSVLFAPKELKKHAPKFIHTLDEENNFVILGTFE